MRGADPADRVHERREPFDGAHCGSFHRAFHTVRTWRKPGANLATVADRMCTALADCVHRWNFHRALDYVHCGSVSTCGAGRTSLLHLGWPRAVFRDRCVGSQRVAFRCAASLYASCAHTFGTRGSSDARGARLIRETLVASQVMLTIMLVAASISVGRAFLDLIQVDRGFDRTGLVTVNVSLEGTTHEEESRALAYFEEALARIRRLPGIHSASATASLPLYATQFMGGPFGMDGRPAEESSMLVPVMPDYFRTMGGRLLRGREFTAAEAHGGARVAIVSERFAGEFGWPADALGREVTIGNAPPWRWLLLDLRGTRQWPRGRSARDDSRYDPVGGPPGSRVRSEDHGAADV